MNKNHYRERGLDVFYLEIDQASHMVLAGSMVKPCSLWALLAACFALGSVPCGETKEQDPASIVLYGLEQLGTRML